MPGPRITLAQVAERAGVSRTTASFVLSGRRDMRIGNETAQRVLQAARELSYRPNLLARSLRTNLTQTIGFISDVIATEIFAHDAIRGALATALLRQHLLFVGETEGDAEVERNVVQAMLDRGVSGFVFGAMYTKLVTPTPVLRAQPLVLMNCLLRTDNVLTAVIPDERQAGRDAVTALLDAGHRQGIVVLGETPDHVIAARERRRGINEALAGVGLGEPVAIDCLWWPTPARVALSAALADGLRPSALLCMNDRVAMGAYQAVNRAGLQVGQDVSVVSFDDSEIAGWLDPGLSSVAIPHLEMGSRAVELLIEPESSPRTHVVPMPITVRGSIGVPARR